MTGRTLALTCLLFAAPLFGQERRLVSRIEVAGNAPAQLVVSQTAIEAGRSYSDRDLEVAIARIRRLPFVYDARYSLDGDTLSIEVDTVTRFSANIAVSASSFPDEVSGQGDIGGGARFFAGSGGVARVTVNKFLAEGGDFRTLAADYSHYGIGGTRLFANAAIGKTFDGDDDFEPDPTWQLTIGYPLTLRQTISASINGTGFESHRSFTSSRSSFETTTASTERALSVRWTYDTSNDPFFAQRGEVINVTPSWTSRDRRSHSISSGPSGGPTTTTSISDGTITRFDLDATKFWPLGTRNLIFSGIGASTQSSDLNATINGTPIGQFDPDPTSLSATLGFARNLFDWSAPLPSPRQRLEIGVRGSRTTRDEPGRTYPVLEAIGLTGGWTLRRQYMDVRLHFSYDFD